MDDLKPLAVFAEVVDAGSMSAAARRLGMSPSAVSQTIRALEQHGGVTLLHRSTRKLALTEAGERYYPHCQRMLEVARVAAQSLQQFGDERGADEAGGTDEGDLHEVLQCIRKG